MEYWNKRNGIVIDIQSKLKGNDWEPVTNEEKSDKEVQQETPVAPLASIAEPEPPVASESDPNEPTGNEDIDSLGKKDIIQELEAMGIEHNPRDKKQVLYDLMMRK